MNKREKSNPNGTKVNCNNIENIEQYLKTSNDF